jgi:cation diffusion facilitator CzcD-associated flavoprotein CzcO
MTAYTGLLLRGRQWRNRTYDDLRVAVIARGCDAAEIVPTVAQTARSVKVFQEQPDWLLPGPRLLSLPPLLRRSAARFSLRRAVPDPWIRRRLTPNGKFNKRPMLIDRHYYAALQQPNCDLITWPVYALVPQGVRSAEGIEHHVDCIIIGESSVLTGDTDREESCA